MPQNFKDKFEEKCEKMLFLVTTINQILISTKKMIHQEIDLEKNLEKEISIQ